MKRLEKLTSEKIQAYQKIFFEYSKKPFGRNEFILDYYERIRATDLAEICCCSPRLVQHITLNHGIRRKAATKSWTKEEEITLLDDYIQLSKEELEVKYNCKFSAISAKVEKLKNGNRKNIYIVGEGVRHHINGDASDNSVDNLYVFQSLGEHKTCHRTLNMCLWKLLPDLLKEGKIRFSNGKYYIP